ncbi:hypothetical protein LMJF_06_0450 [Leishmania major strain Friedlin]|uniref:Uncharacterized protein n=1 Tax=Leishmania major TaxID=5664 RepID=Q4QJ33_LEIMA|nr:hypothetical protein LMJF_06_0450 [Leishmania major strain Friedlin]CAG9568840.1 hypothetical_protein_-_conserved [Leishmania major strain Friedlin]CAJ02090.1 hypothetical protein LMJF_06_0450 [Leishmania major strain Friedlin]|eukprot:XP_001680815.1 hypothetical protein LMJF_06_0450 [Leishmania major strain Friedlin]
MPAHRRYSSVSSSSSRAFSEPSDGGTSSVNDSNSYYSEGSGSYRSVSSVLASRSGAKTTAATTASSTSAVDSSSTNTFSDVLTTSSAYSHSSAPPRRAVTRPAASRSEAVGHKTTKGASGVVVADHNNTGVGETLAQRTASTFTAPTTASSVTVDGTDGLVRAPQSLMLQAALAPVSNRTANVARVKPCNVSEEELVHHPWAPVDCDTTVDASKEGGDRGGLALNVLDTIHTVPIAVPLPPEEAPRRREEGSPTYPSRLAFRVVPSSSPLRHSDSAVTEDKDGTGNGGGGAALGADGATAPRARKTSIACCCCCCLHGCGEKAPCNTKRYTATRQKPHHPLRSHHVPLVSFRTTREHGIPMEGVQNVLPSVEEAARYQNLKVDMMGTEEFPKLMRKAIQPRDRLAGGLRLEKSYAFGHGAGGGRGGAGQSAFVRDGDPQGFWIAHLHRCAIVRLEPIGAE